MMLHSTCSQIVAVVTFVLLTFLVTTGLTLECYRCDFKSEHPDSHPCFSSSDAHKTKCSDTEGGENLCYSAAILGKEKKLLFSTQDCVSRPHDKYGECIANLYGKSNTCLKLPVHEYLKKKAECDKLKPAAEGGASEGGEEGGDIQDTPDTFVYFCHCKEDLCNGADPTDSVDGTDDKNSSAPYSPKTLRRDNVAFVFTFVSAIGAILFL